MKKNFVCLAMMSSLLPTVAGCVTIPDGATPVKPFVLSKYLGTWYEIARIDFRHERNLENTKAEYNMNYDGEISVVNSGYNSVTGEYTEAKGKVKFASDDGSAMMKVSFWGPFYSGYNVIALDDDYQYALVAGDNHKYLWLLSREKSIPDIIRRKYLQIAKEAGYDTSKLLWVNHN